MSAPRSPLRMPLKPTWRRYRAIFIEHAALSIYRALEYEALSRVAMTGRLLDFGGGERAHYRPLLNEWLEDGSCVSVNIAPEMVPTHVIAPGAALPVAPESFDTVLSVNTLEHVYDLEDTLARLLRALKPGGKLVLAVPFLYRVHGCPQDYHRPTASWWQETLARLGVEQLAITPLVWDAMTTGLAVTEGAGPFRKLRRRLVPLYGLLYAGLRAPGDGERYPEEVGLGLSNLALGYVIEGVKSA